MGTKLVSTRLAVDQQQIHEYLTAPGQDGINLWPDHRAPVFCSVRARLRARVEHEEGVTVGVRGVGEVIGGYLDGHTDVGGSQSASLCVVGSEVVT